MRLAAARVANAASGGGPSALVLAVASAIRFPNYDVAWFGIDQVYFLSEARRILAGATDVVGPLSSGLTLLGPLYSYLVAGLLWINNDAAFVGLFGAVCEVASAWFVFDAARRLAGTTAGIVAGVTYAVSPILVLSTRLIWNPSLLPMMVAIGWWMAVRYAENPKLIRLIGTTLSAGLMLPLHPTGIFPAAGVVLAALLVRSPTLPHLAAATVAGLLPLTPTLLRMTKRSGDIGTLGTLLTFPSDLFSAVPGIVSLFLSFPSRLAPNDRTAVAASVGLYILAGIGTIGALRGITDPRRERRIWIALVTTCLVYLVAAVIYSGGITWYYLLAFVPMFALSIAGALRDLPPRLQMAGAVAVVACAAAQLAFLQRFDAAARASGILRVDSRRLMIHRPPGEAYSLTMREVRAISDAAAPLVPDGATALMTVHGIRGELWRESGAEFLPWAARPHRARPAHFTVVGRGAAPLKEDAQLLGQAVCASSPDSIRWRGQHRAVADWETPAFRDAEWFALELPRRTEAPSLAADDPRFALWRSGRLVLRGRYVAGGAARKRFLVVTVHSAPLTAVGLTEIFINGAAVQASKERVMYGIYRNQEWLIDLSDRVKPGENLIALGFGANGASFDLDVFEVPCTDAEFYF